MRDRVNAEPGRDPKFSKHVTQCLAARQAPSPKFERLCGEPSVVGLSVSAKWHEILLQDLADSR